MFFMMQFITVVMLGIVALAGADRVVYNPKITGTPTIHPGPNGTQIIFNGTLPSNVAIHNPLAGVAICPQKYDSPAYADKISDGIAYLIQKGDVACSAGYLPDSTFCQRVSCSYNSAIYVCNYGHDAPVSPACNQVGNYAQSILDSCQKFDKGQKITEGQLWDNGDWDQGGYYVQVAGADC
ncbi:hypothetical protein PG995_007302 [Apiospora arundinis]